MKHRILILIKGLGRGGAEQLIVSAAPYFDRDRFEYEVAYLLPWKDALVEELHAAGVRVHPLHARRGPGWLWRLRRLVAERRYDVIHSHSPATAALARLVSGRRVAHVYTEHGIWDRYHRLTYWANALTYPRNAHVFAVSEFVASFVRYPRIVRRRRMPTVEVLYQGLDAAAAARWDTSPGIREELGIGDGAPVIGTVANFRPQKRHDLLLRAAAILRREIPDARFVLVGDGPLEGQARRLAEDLDLNGTVIFAGRRDDVPRVVSSFDVFVMSSAYEGLSIALLEAMALGRPPVVTNVGGISELVQDGLSGMTVPPGDPEALAAGLVKAIRDPALRARLAEGARRRAAEFDIRSSVRRQEQVYSQVAERRGSLTR